MGNVSLRRQIGDISTSGMSLTDLMVQSQRLPHGDVGTVFNLTLLAELALLGRSKQKLGIEKYI